MRPTRTTEDGPPHRVHDSAKDRCQNTEVPLLCSVLLLMSGSVRLSVALVQQVGRTSMKSVEQEKVKRGTVWKVSDGAITEG